MGIWFQTLETSTKAAIPTCSFQTSHFTKDYKISHSQNSNMIQCTQALAPFNQYLHLPLDEILAHKLHLYGAWPILCLIIHLSSFHIKYTPYLQQASSPANHDYVLSVNDNCSKVSLTPRKRKNGGGGKINTLVPAPKLVSKILSRKKTRS